MADSCLSWHLRRARGGPAASPVSIQNVRVSVFKSGREGGREGLKEKGIGGGGRRSYQITKLTYIFSTFQSLIQLPPRGMALRHGQLRGEENGGTTRVYERGRVA